MAEILTEADEIILDALTSKISKVRTELHRITGSSQTLPWQDFATKIAEIIGLDGLMKSSGYPQAFAEHLKAIIAGQDTALVGLDEYTANACYNNEHSGIVYAPELPVKSGSCANLFRDCTNLYAFNENIDWSKATNLSYAFDNTNLFPTTITLNCPNCTTFSNFGGNFTEMHFVNTRKNTSYYYTFGAGIEKVTGLWMSNLSTTGNSFYLSRVCSPELSFDGLTIDDDGVAIFTAENYILSGRIFGSSVEVMRKYLPNIDAKSLLSFAYLAYDWKNNPLELTPKNIYEGLSSSYLTINYTDAQKQKMETAFPDINIRKILEDKGWTY